MTAATVLLATNIIESGLDIPTANTMVIHRADMFGLAQLYQLRGRIGRSKLRGYAYSTPPGKALTETAQRRSEVMQTLDQLGAASLLPATTSTSAARAACWATSSRAMCARSASKLYQHLLEEAVREAKGTEKAAAQDWTPQINIGMPVLIPESYVQDLNVRLGLYRRLADLAVEQEIDAFAAELIDRFGPLPVEAENLLQVVAFKQLCRSSGVERLEIGPKGAVIAFKDNRFARPEKLVEFITKRQTIVTLRPDHRLVYRQDWADTKARMNGVKKLMQNLSTMAA